MRILIQSYPCPSVDNVPFFFPSDWLQNLLFAFHFQWFEYYMHLFVFIMHFFWMVFSKPLGLQFGVYHSFLKMLSHYVFRYFFCPILFLFSFWGFCHTMSHCLVLFHSYCILVVAVCSVLFFLFVIQVG